MRSLDEDCTVPEWESKIISLIIQIVSLVRTMDLALQPKPEARLMSLITQTVTLFNSVDSDLNLKSLLISLISLIRQIVSVVIYLNSKLKNLISLCPQVGGYFSEGKFQMAREVKWTSDGTWNYFLGKWKKFSLTGEVATHFRCESCNGKYHKEYEMAPLQIKPHLHQKYYLPLVLKRYFNIARTNVQFVIKAWYLVSSMSAVKKNAGFSYMFTVQRFLSH
ncbi:BnaA07g09570D [Brassica napus]|uniref:BnaA07g09570D protein n=1 Tax=Brassica napus TaxID=3708 RepID=A0A078GH86_BRANA|nr:BnaA07g09570D [Brassica napus]